MDALTDAEKAKLLADLGMTDHAAAFDTPNVVADAVVEIATATPERDDVDKVATELLRKAKGNIDTAKQLAINWAQAEFDKVKLSKIAAAQLGVDKTAHNKAEYARIQAMRERVNSAMRKQARGHVATKIAAKKETASNPELDAFLLAHQGNPEIAQLMKLLGNN